MVYPVAVNAATSAEPSARARDATGTRWPRIALACCLFTLACGQEPPPEPASRTVAITRPVGAWQGRGDRTIGFVSDSGRLRVEWETQDEDPPGSGSFRLSVHSAVSGRPIRLVADHVGEGRGAADVDDDPRPYNLMIESRNVEWHVRVEEIVAGQAPDAAPTSNK